VFCPISFRRVPDVSFSFSPSRTSAPIALELVPTKALRAGAHDVVHTTRPRSVTVTEPPLQMVAWQSVLQEEEQARAARPGTARAREVSPAADVAGTRDRRRTTVTPRSGSHPCRRSARADRRPHRGSPASTASPEIGAPGWNGPRSHGRRWNAREHSTTTGRSSFGLGPRCSACFARLRVHTQMSRRRSFRYVYSFRRSFHLISTPT
jgi:hypothetical protein